jgi:hypothetical protein
VRREVVLSGLNLTDEQISEIENSVRRAVLSVIATIDYKGDLTVRSLSESATQIKTFDKDPFGEKYRTKGMMLENAPPPVIEK